MANKYTAGEVTTVGELEVGDTVFLRETRQQTGLPSPTHPATVAELVPLADGRVQVRVTNAESGASVEPRLLGQLPATREFRRASAV
jgi:hypothetical protein